MQRRYDIILKNLSPATPTDTEETTKKSRLSEPHSSSMSVTNSDDPRERDNGLLKINRILTESGPEPASAHN